MLVLGSKKSLFDLKLPFWFLAVKSIARFFCNWLYLTKIALLRKSLRGKKSVLCHWLAHNLRKLWMVHVMSLMNCLLFVGVPLSKALFSSIWHFFKRNRSILQDWILIYGVANVCWSCWSSPFGRFVCFFRIISRWRIIFKPWIDRTFFVPSCIFIFFDWRSLWFEIVALKSTLFWRFRVEINWIEII